MKSLVCRYQLTVGGAHTSSAYHDPNRLFTEQDILGEAQLHDPLTLDFCLHNMKPRQMNMGTPTLSQGNPRCPMLARAEDRRRFLG